MLHTMSQHIAFQITKILRDNHLNKVLITGGGAYNRFLISLLPSDMKSLPSSELIEYKEALIFALMGYLRLQNKVNILASATGASNDHSSGKIVEPQ